MEKTLNKLFNYNYPSEKMNIKGEITAGITTFLAMAYIVAVNPSILGKTGMPEGALVTSTCIAAAIATLVMAFYSKLPFGLACGMGLNTFFAYNVCIQDQIPWQVALTAVFVEGVIFIILSLTNVREAVANILPVSMKISITSGIGLFIAFIGLQNAGIIVGNKSNLVALGSFSNPSVWIACIGLVIIAVLESREIKGSILIGILIGTGIAWIYAIFYPVTARNVGITLPTGIVYFASPMPIVGKLDFSYLNSTANILAFIGITSTFLFVDFFGTVGSVIGLATRADLVDENGNFKRMGRALLTDAIGTTIGACLGVSAISTFVESSTGIEEGGRTGLTAFVIAILFIISMFFSPIFTAIPSCATAPALIYVGYLMLSMIKNLDFKNITEAVPAFITVLIMPLAYSIGDGIIYGIMSYVAINFLNNLFSKKEDRQHISIILWILFFIFLIKLIL